MKMTRRGFLQLLGGSVAVAALPISVPVQSEIAFTTVAPILPAAPAGGNLFNCIRSITASFEPEFIEYTTIDSPITHRTPSLSRICLDVEIYLDGAPIPQVGDYVDAKWFQENGLRKLGMFNNMPPEAEIFPADVQLLVDGSTIDYRVRELIVARLHMVEVKK